MDLNISGRSTPPPPVATPLPIVLRTYITLIPLNDCIDSHECNIIFVKTPLTMHGPI